MLAILNAIIHTLDPARPRASALLIRGDRIAAVGDDRQVLSAASGPVERLDLKRLAVVPGFIDAHIHLLSYGLSLRVVDLDNLPSLRRCVEKVRERVKQTAPGAWVTGRGWNYTVWEEARPPHRSDLDPVSPGHPVLLTSKNGHQAWCNTSALRLAGVDRNTPDPPGGRIERDTRREPTGVLSEEAIGLVSGRVPPPSPEDLRSAFLDAQRVASAHGLTGFHDCDAHGYDGVAMRGLLDDLHRSGHLALRAYLMIPDHRIDEAIASGWRTGDGSDYVRIGPVKVFADGALGPRTADLLDPYEGEPLNRGIVVADDGRLLDLTTKAHRSGLRIAVHAIGDRAVRRCLDAFEKSQQEVRGDFRPRVEHIQLIHPDDLPRFKRLGVVASMQPIHATSDMHMADRFWGGRSRRSYAWRSLIDAGAVLAFGSDCPVEPLDPLAGLHAALTRQRPDGVPRGGWTPEQRITQTEALRAYTCGSAYAAGQEADLGTLSPGKFADLVVLSQDPFDLPPEEIPRAEVVMTMVGGKIVYENKGV